MVVTMQKSNGSAAVATAAIYYCHGEKTWRLGEDWVTVESLLEALRVRGEPVEMSILQADPSPDMPGDMMDRLMAFGWALALAITITMVVIFALLAVES